MICLGFLFSCSLPTIQEVRKSMVLIPIAIDGIDKDIYIQHLERSRLHEHLISNGRSHVITVGLALGAFPVRGFA